MKFSLELLKPKIHEPLVFKFDLHFKSNSVTKIDFYFTARIVHSSMSVYYSRG
jgi:hypothetical protein